MIPVVGIGLMCKAPRPGLSKTRLAASIGAPAAAALAAAFLRDIGATLARVATDEPALVVRAFYRPADAATEIAVLLPPAVACEPQDGGDLGGVMAAALTRLLADCPGGALLVGSDVPTLPATVLADAITALRAPGRRAVLGPSRDGGYYLIGLQSTDQMALLDPLPWSTPDVLPLTRRRAETLAIALHEVATHFDVDDAAGLAFLRSELADAPAPVAPVTRAALRALALAS